jgi:hypothetical protein
MTTGQFLRCEVKVKISMCPTNPAWKEWECKAQGLNLADTVQKAALCQMVRSGQPTGVLIHVVYLFDGEESKAKNSKIAHEYAEHREHIEFILVRAFRE